MDRQKESGGKLCLHCMRSIPLLAGRCPYCLEEDQGVLGRVLLILLVLVIIVAGSFYYKNKHSKQENVIQPQQNSSQLSDQETRERAKKEADRKLREFFSKMKN